MRHILKLVAAILLCSVFGFSAARPIVLTGGKLLTITHGTIDKGVLIMDGGKITAVGKSRRSEDSRQRAGHRCDWHDRLSRTHRFGNSSRIDRD